MLVDLVYDFFHIVLNVFDHFLDLVYCLFNLAVLNLTNLYRLDTGFLNSLYMAIPYHFHVSNQFRIVISQRPFL